MPAQEELNNFRAAFGLAPDVDLVAEFDRRRGRDLMVIRNLQAQLYQEHLKAEAHQGTLATISAIIRPAGAAIGTNVYFQIRDICEAKR